MGTNVFKRLWHFVRDIEVILSLCGILATLPLVGGITTVLLNQQVPEWMIAVIISTICAVLSGFLLGLVYVIQKRRHEKRMLQLLAATVQFLEKRQNEAQKRNIETFQSILEFDGCLLSAIQSLERRKADKPEQTPLERWLS